MVDLVPADKFSRLPERYQRRAREIAHRVAEIDALCHPATADDIGAELKRLRGQFLPQPGADDRSMAEGFRFACRDLPHWAISEAVNDYLEGRVENHTGRYMPISAEFAKRVRDIILPSLAERSSLRTEAEKLIERARDEARRNRIAIERADPAVRRRVADMVEQMSAGAPKKITFTHEGLPPEKQAALDALKKPRQFVSKIAETKIGKR